MSYDAQAVFSAAGVLTFEDRFLDPGQPTGLWFCATAEDVAVVGINAVKLAQGAEWGELRRCERFLTMFPYCFVAVRADELRETIVRHLQQAAPALPICVPTEAAWRGCGSVTAFADAFGPKRVPELLLGARQLPAYGLLNMADIRPVNPGTLSRTLSGIREMDQFTGGFYEGQMSLWTGERGKGKSTLLGQMLLEAIDQGRTVCAYSGELSREQFKHWVSIQAAGPAHVGVYEDADSGRKVSAIADSVQRRIDEWWDRRFFLYDIGTASSHNEDDILTVFANAARCYGADVFLVDNVMTVGLRNGRDSDYFRAQSNFAGRLVQFAKQWHVHVHLVAHPRKAEKGQKHIRADDIGGSGDLPNRADNVFTLEPEQQEIRGKLESVTVLSCIKNRMYGGTRRVALKFDVKSKRFYRPDAKPDKQYGWELVGRQVELCELPAEEVPFEGAVK